MTITGTKNNKLYTWCSAHVPLPKNIIQLIKQEGIKILTINYGNQRTI